jgi:hypothetical protein
MLPAHLATLPLSLPLLLPVLAERPRRPRAVRLEPLRVLRRALLVLLVERLVRVLLQAALRAVPAVVLRSSLVLPCLLPSRGMLVLLLL